MKKRLRNYGFAWVLAAGLPCITLVANSEPLTLTTLASGQLGMGAIGLFNFTLTQSIQSGDTLTLNTIGSKFDTEIALYNASGYLVATNDDIAARNLLSQLKFGQNQLLPAGNYTVVLSGSNTIFRTGNIIPGTSKGGEFQLNLETTQPVLSPSLADYQAMNGTLLPTSIQEIELASGWLTRGEIGRFDFTLDSDTLGGDWLTIYTQGQGFDSEIGLYDSTGKLIATNDDIGARNLLSQLSFGLDGDNGRQLLKGNYTLLVGGFNSFFYEGFEATSSSTWQGNYAVYLQSSSGASTAATRALSLSQQIPEPATLWLTGLGLVLLLRSRKQPAMASNKAS